MAEDPPTVSEESGEKAIEDTSLDRESVAEDEALDEEEQLPESWFITGANGNLGQRLIRKLLSEGADVTAVVRSTRAERELSRAVNFNNKLRIEVIDYSETILLGQAAYGAQFAVHLVGILKATKHATYAAAHEASCTSYRALFRAHQWSILHTYRSWARSLRPPIPVLPPRGVRSEFYIEVPRQPARYVYPWSLVSVITPLRCWRNGRASQHLSRFEPAAWNNPFLRTM